MVAETDIVNVFRVGRGGKRTDLADLRGGRLADHRGDAAGGERIAAVVVEHRTPGVRPIALSPHNTSVLMCPKTERMPF